MHHASIKSNTTYKRKICAYGDGYAYIFLRKETNISGSPEFSSLSITWTELTFNLLIDPNNHAKEIKLKCWVYCRQHAGVLLMQGKAAFN